MATEKHEYNGEMLTKSEIAQKAGVSYERLSHWYNRLGNIEEAVKKIKENQEAAENNKVEYYGERMSFTEIAKKEDLDPGKLIVHYKKTNDIYKAVENAKKAKEKRYGNIEYNGKIMTRNSIAKEVGVSDNALKKYYEETGDIYEAVRRALEGQKEHYGIRIEYYGDLLNISKISKLENVNAISLRKHYGETGDIYKAVEIAKHNQQTHKQIIEYNGKKTTITAIAKEIGISPDSLREAFKKVDDIDAAIEIVQRNREIQNAQIEYYGVMTNFTAIAKSENVAVNTLKRYYAAFNNIYKAVMISKNVKRKEKKVKIDNVETSLEDLAKTFNTSSAKIDKIIDKVDSLDELEKRVSGKKSYPEEKIMYGNISLRRYCLENSYNYNVILYMIRNFDKSAEDAVNEYVKNGQSLPNYYIYAKYNVLLYHLMLRYNINYYKVLKIMKNDDCLLEKALKKYIFTTDNGNYNFTSTVVNWMMELSEFLQNCSEEEKENAQEIFYITPEENAFLKEKTEKVAFINRQLLLFEFSEVLSRWNNEELLEMFDLYNITDEEIITIYNELYQPFIKGVINPKSEDRVTYDKINMYIRNAIFGIASQETNLSEEEKVYCDSKINLINNILNMRKNYLQAEENINR